MTNSALVILFTLAALTQAVLRQLEAGQINRRKS
jgi:hypothetical protein